jgi:pyruvate dehydrogenase (quinone)
MPQAIGAQLASPGQQVIAMCGDGGLSMLLGDLLTIVQQNLPVKLVVFNNGVLGMVDLEMLVAGLPDFGTDIGSHDFAAIASAAGIHSVSVDDRDGVEPGLLDVLRHDGPALCDIRTDPQALSIPPKITAGQAGGFALSMLKKSLNGHIDEVLDAAKTNLRNIPRP